jgi:hypothetical protein
MRKYHFLILMFFGCILFAYPLKAQHGPERNRPTTQTPPPAPPSSPETAEKADKIAPDFVDQWYEGETLVRQYRSKEQWSGEGSDWSNWYKVTSGPPPPGYTLTSASFQLLGDRNCTGDQNSPVVQVPGQDAGVNRRVGHGDWAVCFEDIRDSQAVTWQFAMQGHDEEIRIKIDAITCTDKDHCPNFKGHLENTKATSVGLITAKFDRPKLPFNFDKPNR